MNETITTGVLVWHQAISGEDAVWTTGKWRVVCLDGAGWQLELYGQIVSRGLEGRDEAMVRAESAQSIFDGRTA